ncbi:MAG: biotin--[acetyl-CoA-carboxylase] ligase [Oscillospiraceae bacterium]|jgi:BirA family biotin operon repressor/biotin-[acetyl-CoA-carboxylase] ligase|nr:biotin--[acetyl-CoA-carboxylase] ligase [Oscillospiraceae bacterium]
MDSQLSCARLAEMLAGLPITPHTFDALPSTNTELLARAKNGAPEGTLLAAASQTAGRGTRGRAYFCPPDTGVYFSLLLRPRALAEVYGAVTPAAAVAVAEAIDAVFGVCAGIKWVNDVYLRGKKVAGILAEASTETAGGAACIVLGVGVNLAEPPGGFPDLPNAGAILERGAALDETVRVKLAAEAARRFWGYYERLGERAFLPAYRDRSILLGRRISYTRAGETRCATAYAIDGDFRLAVRAEDGRAEKLSFGEVQLQLCET